MYGKFKILKFLIFEILKILNFLDFGVLPYCLVILYLFNCHLKEAKGHFLWIWLTWV